MKRKNTSVKIRTTKKAERALKKLKIEKGYKNLHQALVELLKKHPEVEFRERRGYSTI